MATVAGVKNKKYQKYQYNRKLARDSVEGTVSIKTANEVYLPIPAGYLMDGGDVSSSYSSKTRNVNDGGSENIRYPWWHENAAYMAYLQRARYPEIVPVALMGLVGVATKKQAVCELPASISYMEFDAAKTGESIYEVFANVLLEVLTVGNVFPMVDVDPVTNNLFIELIKAENFIDWDESSDGITYANVEIKSTERNAKYEVVEVQKNYIFEIKDSKSVVSVYEDDILTEDKKNISRQGYDFETVPIFPIGSNNNNACPQNAPVVGLANIAVSIYQKDADLSNAEYMTCNPNMVITGADNSEEDGVPNVVGSQVALVISNPDAKVYYTETDTSALDHMLKRIESLFIEAAMYSVSIVGREKKSAESEATVEMRQNSQSATLVNIVKNINSQFTNILKFCAKVSGSNPDDVSFKAPLDFSQRYISPEMLSALMSAFAQRGLSLRTLLTNFKEAGLLPDGVDVDQEITEITSMAPAV